MSLGEDGHSQLGAGFKVTAHECRPPVMIAQQPTLASLPGRATSRRWFSLSSSLVDEGTSTSYAFLSRVSKTLGTPHEHEIGPRCKSRLPECWDNRQATT